MPGQMVAGVTFPGSTDARIEQAIAERVIGPHLGPGGGTLHLLAATDLRWRMLALLSAQLIAGTVRQ